MAKEDIFFKNVARFALPFVTLFTIVCPLYLASEPLIDCDFNYLYGVCWIYRFCYVL